MLFQITVVVNLSEDVKVAFLHHMEVNFHHKGVLLHLMEVPLEAAELKDVEPHLEHHKEDSKVALDHHVEVLSVAVMVLTLDATVVKVVLFLTIIMVVATDVPIFMAKVLHVLTATLVEVALDAILEPVVFQVVAVSSASPVYLDN